MAVSTVGVCYQPCDSVWSIFCSWAKYISTEQAHENNWLQTEVFAVFMIVVNDALVQVQFHFTQFVLSLYCCEWSIGPLSACVD